MFYRGGGQTFLCLMLLFNSSVIGTFYIANTIAAPSVAIIKAIAHFMISFCFIYVIGAIIYYIPWHMARIIIKGILLAAAAIVCIADWFLLYQYGDVLDQSKLAVLLGTDWGTAWEFIHVYVLHAKVIICLLCCLLLMAGLTYKIRHIRLTRRCAVWVLLYLIGSLSVMGYVAGKSVWTDIKTSSEIKNWKYVTFYRHSSLMRFGIDFLAAKNQLGSDAEIYSAMDKIQQEELVDSGNMNVPYVIFILGESTDRNHMSLYGYGLQTTPLLQERQKQGELAVFDDTIACANSTTQAMSMVFNTAPKNYAESGTKWYDYPNLIDTLSKAGYHVRYGFPIRNRLLAGEISKEYMPSVRMNQNFCI